MARLSRTQVMVHVTVRWKGTVREEPSRESLDLSSFLWYQADANRRIVLLACVGILPGDPQFDESLLAEFLGLDRHTQTGLIAILMNRQQS
jgi:hypothetical protein